MDFPSSSSSLEVITVTKDCEVCGGAAQGRHYGATSCRACAAFFRRYGVSNQVKPCRKNNQCVFPKKGWFNCKKCRLQKCRDVGMKIDGFQFGRDPERVLKIPQTMDTFLGKPNFIIYCAPASYSTKVIMDVQYLLDRAENVLIHGSASPASVSNPLEKLAFGLQQLRSQFDMLKGIWKVWTRLDKLAITAAGRRQMTCGNQQIMAHLKNNKVICDLAKVKIDISWCTSYTVEQLQFFNHKDEGTRHESLVQLMLDLQPSDVELCFMMCQLSFHYVGKRFQGIILEIADRFQEILSNHLHDYYMNMNMPQYSGRVAQMMKINNHIQLDILQERAKVELLKVFDVYYADYSHTEIFRDI